MRPRSVPLVRLALTVVVGAATLAMSPRVAGALSCADPGVHSVPELVEALDGEIYGEPMFEQYDFAITATVTDIDTVLTEGAPDYGATTITVDVHHGYATEQITPTLEISAHDPGWMSGYPFEVDSTYFVPLQAETPEGDRNFAFVCSPILELTPDEVDTVAESAPDGLSVVEPLDPGTDSDDTSSDDAAVPIVATDSDATRSIGFPTFTAAAIALAAVIAVVAIATWQRPRRPTPTAHPSTAGRGPQGHG